MAISRGQRKDLLRKDHGKTRKRYAEIMGVHKSGREPRHDRPRSPDGKHDLPHSAGETGEVPMPENGKGNRPPVFPKE